MGSRAVQILSSGADHVLDEIPAPHSVEKRFRGLVGVKGGIQSCCNSVAIQTLQTDRWPTGLSRWPHLVQKQVVPDT
jgi:hypothetical protein